VSSTNSPQKCGNSSGVEFLRPTSWQIHRRDGHCALARPTMKGSGSIERDGRVVFACVETTETSPPDWARCLNRFRILGFSNPGPECYKHPAPATIQADAFNSLYLAPASCSVRGEEFWRSTTVGRGWIRLAAPGSRARPGQPHCGGLVFPRHRARRVPRAPTLRSETMTNIVHDGPFRLHTKYQKTN